MDKCLINLPLSFVQLLNLVPSFLFNFVFYSTNQQKFLAVIGEEEQWKKLSKQQQKLAICMRSSQSFEHIQKYLTLL